MTRKVQYNDIDPNVYDLDEDAVQEEKSLRLKKKNSLMAIISNQLKFKMNNQHIKKKKIFSHINI